MASNYPGALDSLATNKSDATTMATDHAAHHNDLADAVNKIESELGVNPSGSDFSTVVARLDAAGPKVTAAGTLASTYTHATGGNKDSWLFATLGQSMTTITLGGFVAGTRAKWLLSQDATGGRGLTISDGTNTSVLSIPTGANVSFAVDVYSPNGTDLWASVDSNYLPFAGANTWTAKQTFTGGIQVGTSSTTGYVLTMDSLGNATPQHIGVYTCRKTADQTNNTITLANVTDMVLPVVVGADHSFEFWVPYVINSAVNGIGLAVTVPTIPSGYVSYTAEIYRGVDPTAGTATAIANTPYTGSGTVSDDPIVSDTVAAISTVFFAHVKGILSNPSASTGGIQLRFRAEVATSPAVIKKGAWGRMRIN